MRFVLACMTIILMSSTEAIADKDSLKVFLNEIRQAESFRAIENSKPSLDILNGAARERRQATMLAIERIRANRVASELALREIGASIQQTLMQAERDAAREERSQKVSAYLNLAATALSLASAINQLDVENRQVDALPEEPISAPGAESTVSDVAEPEAASPQEQTSEAKTEKPTGSNVSNRTGSKLEKVIENLQKLEDMPADWSVEPSFRLTEAEAIIADTYSALFDIPRSQLDEFAREHRVTFEDVMGNVLSGASPSEFSQARALLKILLSPQTVNDAGPGGDAAIKWYYMELDKHARQYWEWRNRKPYPSIMDFNQIDPNSIQDFLDCQNGCVRSR